MKNRLRIAKKGISIVIPAYNEERFLPATLDSVNAARKHFEMSSGFPSEVVVVNNASTDLTEKVALAHGALTIRHSVRNISAVRNAGIKKAKYRLVVTIDADCFLPIDALIKIWNFMSDESYIGGALGVKVLSKKLFTKIAAPLVQALVFRISGIYGAMFFFWKDSALEIGGFSEDRLVAEDSAFAIALKNHGQKKGKKFGRLKSVQIETLDRKEVGLGTILPAVYQVLRGFAGARQRPEDLKYWYDPKR